MGAFSAYDIMKWKSSKANVRIGIDGVITHNGKRDKKQYHFVFDIIFRTDVGV